MDCKIEANKQTCTCGNAGCPRRGLCCECLRFHVARKSLPMCLRGLDWLKVGQ